jgi:uncharacterized protein (DUF305 family)
MNTKMHKILRTLAMTGVLTTTMMGVSAVAQTPEAVGCGPVGTPAATPGMMEHDMGTQAMMHEMEFDQLYIDMMIPHHESIIAMAEVALTELEDPRLQEIAQTIIDTQEPEQDELAALRNEWYGSMEPAPMDAMMMSMMMEAMPGMGSADAMMMQMNPELQVQAFCAAEDKDLAFIDMTIPHHQMAVDASEIAVEQAVHPEIQAFAERVIADQQREIDELEEIRAELIGEATPAT